MHECSIPHGVRALALALPLLLLFVPPTGCVLAAPAAVDPSLSISIRAAGKLATNPVYVGLIPMDQPPGHPLRETVTSTGKADFAAPAGTYALMTAANGFATNLQEISIAAGSPNATSIDLTAVPVLSGSVSDTEGNPIVGAQVSYAPAASASSFADMSALALQHLSTSMRTTTDENGSWRLPALRFPLYVEADGLAPEWVTPRKDQNAVDVVLQKGSSLQVTLDRTDRSIVIGAIRVSQDEKGVPARSQPRIWGREASALSLDWLSLPAGDYKLVASYPDPLRFAAPVDVGRVTLIAGGSGSVRITLPAERDAAASYVSLRVPHRTDLSGLHAFVRAREGARSVRHSVQDALGGRIIFVDSAVPPADVYLTTRAELITASTEPAKSATKAVDTTLIPRGEGRLHVIPAEGVRLPQVAAVSFSSCTHNEKVTLPVSIPKDGTLGFPLLVPCKAFTLTFGALGTLGLTAAVRPGEEKWLGDHTLTAAATAEVHAVYAGASAAGVIVQATVLRERQKLPVGEAVADDHGVAVLGGLPSGEVTFEARIKETQHAGSTTATLQPGQQIVIDPLEIPEPASLIVTAEFDPQFQSENPGATLFGLVVEREGDVRPKDSRNTDLRERNREVAFDDLAPGTWRVIALVQIDDVAQPVEVDRVELEAAEQKHVTTRIKPLVFSGQVFSNGRGVSTSVGIGDQPGPNAVRRDIQTTSDGKFKVVLPEEGLYRVVVRRSRTAEPIEIGSVAFQAASPSVRIDLPDGALAVRVLGNDVSVAGAMLLATLRVDSPDGSGVRRITRKATTDENGSATFDDLQPGLWTVEAREPRSKRMGEKSVAVARSVRAETTLQLNDPNQFKGIVIDERGGLAAGASIDCIFLGAGGVLRAVHGEADDAAVFSIPLPDPAPSRLDCGVSTASGAIAAFSTAPGEHVELALPQSTASVTIADWGERVIPDRFWLAATDGRVFNLSWAAKKFGRLWSPLTIARLPAGQWNVVRVDSAAALTAIARGTARSLPAVANIRAREGQSTDIRIQDGAVAQR